MSLPYLTISNYTDRINSGSYFDETDSELFVQSPVAADYWYGFSEHDVIEFSYYDLDTNQLGWRVFDQGNSYTSITSSYKNELDQNVNYSYKRLNQTYIQYKNNEILLKPTDDLTEFDVSSGNYILSYNFVRNVAGDQNIPLVIKDISPSRKELKLIPLSDFNAEYTAFCLHKFQIKDVVPLFLSGTSQCPYSKIYNAVKDENIDTINFIKSIFFIPSDGDFLVFLKNFYEDYFNFSTSLTNSTSITRIQGIKTYFSNYLLSHYEIISDFDSIKLEYNSIVDIVVNNRFSTFKSMVGPKYIDAKKFLYDFFTTNYFYSILNTISTSYNDKYFSYLKNGLNLGSGRILTILNHNYLDEKAFPEDHLTLLVKLQNELPNDIAIKTSCWVSNISLIPQVFNVVVSLNSGTNTFTISPPDFSVDVPNISITNTNKVYTSTDIQNDPTISQSIYVNKQISDLNIDYSDFSNFINFSSAELRINIFKNKMIQLAQISSSVAILQQNVSSSIASGSTWPLYQTELTTLQNQQTETITSFDGYESYLYKSGSYEYNLNTKSFINAGYVSDQDVSAKEYDTNNRDSLVNNTPVYILEDANNNDYLIFLAMIGHHFDNIYNYIACLPSAKTTSNNITDTFTKKIIEQMLTSFGWKIDTTIEQLNLSSNYLSSADIPGNDAVSGDDRAKTIWNRILINLPIIYKAKGTEECIKLILSCYGIPASLFTIKEYGGVDYTDPSEASYTLDERVFLLTYGGNNSEYIITPATGSLKTIEFKLAVDPTRQYGVQNKIPLVVKKDTLGNTNWTLGIYKEYEKYLGRVYLDIYNKTLITSKVPVFNGEIFSVLFRRNYPYGLFEDNDNLDLIPTQYDLEIKRNENQRTIFYSTGSMILEKDYNMSASLDGHLYFGNYISNNFFGNIDKILLWTNPISASNFDDHANNLNSYSSTTGSNAYLNLLFRMNYEYPVDFYTTSTNGFKVVNASDHYSSSISGSAFNFPIIAVSHSYNPNTCGYITSSVYPYQFTILDSPQTFTVANYGPNKFRNNKIRKIEQEAIVRLDPNDKSTNPINATASPDSTQIGFFIDPQDYKNKDIYRYLGNKNLMELVGDPNNLYSDKYYDLINLNCEYNSSGNKKVLFNEIITLYKFYFNRSIFDVIKNVIPARGNLLTGLLIEPTVLERSKYENKPINAELTNISSSIFSDQYGIATGSFEGVISNIVQFGMSAEYLPSESLNSLSDTNQYPDVNFSLSYIADPNRDYDVNFGGNYISDLPDEYQLGTIAFTDINGTNGVLDNDNYLLKKWTKQSIYNRIGPVYHSNIPNQDVYVSASTWTYNLIAVNKSFYDSIVYTTQSYSSTDLSDKYYTSITIGSTTYTNVYQHNANTFQNTPNRPVSNVIATGSYGFFTTRYKLAGPLGIIDEHGASTDYITNNDDNVYFEIFSGNYTPRNHYEHKAKTFSKESFGQRIDQFTTPVLYIKSRQTSQTTIGTDGLNDGSQPVESINVSNVNIIKSSNVLNI